MNAVPERGTTSETPVASHDDPFTMQVLDGMIRLRWNSGVVVERHDAAKVIEQARLISRRWTLPMLSEFNGMQYMSRRAMQMFAQELDVAALATVGSSPVDHAITGFFKQVHEPSFPVQHFTTAESAFLWLKGGSAEPEC